MELTPTDYILLAYLNQEPVYAYRLVEQLKQESINSWAKYSAPHIYYSLRKLRKAGYLEVEIKPQKTGPPQKIYSLSAKGKKLIGGPEILESLVSEENYFGFDLVLGLSNKLEIPNDELIILVEKRLEVLREQLKNVQAEFREKELANQMISSGAKISFKHKIRFLKGEIDFYRKSIKELKK